MKMTGAELLSDMGCFIVMEKIKDPAGETQTLEPRPRPATWVVAVTVKPSGTLERSFGFLGPIVSKEFHELQSMDGSYFSSKVLVLVTTSPYNKFLPKSSACPPLSNWYFCKFA